VVLVNQHGRVVSYARVRLARRDVEALFQNGDLLRSGWEAELTPASLDEGQNVIRAFVYSLDGQTAYQLHGEYVVHSA
jgi:hypothetical protein